MTNPGIHENVLWSRSAYNDLVSAGFGRNLRHTGDGRCLSENGTPRQDNTHGQGYEAGLAAGQRFCDD